MLLCQQRFLKNLLVAVEAKEARLELESIEVYRKVKSWLQIIMEMLQIKSFKQDAAWCHQSLCEVINLSHSAFSRVLPQQKKNTSE